MEIKSGKNIGHTKRSSGMPRTGRYQHFNNSLPDLAGFNFKLFNFFFGNVIAHTWLYYLKNLNNKAKPILTATKTSKTATTDHKRCSRLETEILFSKLLINCSTFLFKTSGRLGSTLLDAFCATKNLTKSKRLTTPTSFLY